MMAAAEKATRKTDEAAEKARRKADVDAANALVRERRQMELEDNLWSKRRDLDRLWGDDKDIRYAETVAWEREVHKIRIASCERARAEVKEKNNRMNEAFNVRQMEFARLSHSKRPRIKED
jgi:hypothetical protein